MNALAGSVAAIEALSAATTYADLALVQFDAKVKCEGPQNQGTQPHRNDVDVHA